MNLRGAITALITPFRDGRLDEGRLRQLVERQVERGVDGLVPTGTTGESPTLSHEEHRRVVEIVIEAAGGRVPVIAGTGSNSTQEALELTRHAAEAGASASLQVVPYYNKPTQEGMYRHFMAIAEGVDLPLVLYNIPGRTGKALEVDTICRLAEHPNIVAIKEATGSMDVSSEIAQRLGPENFAILSGDDSLTLPLMAVGAKGVISVASNLIPDRMAALTRAALGNDFEAARRIHLEMFPLFRGMFLETNPIPIKTAMALAGLDTGELRLPLCPMAEENAATLRSILQELDLLAEKQPAG